MRSFDCWEPPLSKKYWYRVNRGLTIFQSQQYSSCSKAGWVPGYTAAGKIPQEFANRQLGDTTLGCTANFPGNWISQPRILCPLGRSGLELPVEYQVETRFINFSVSTAKKGCRHGPGSRNLEESLVKATISQPQYWYQKSYDSMKIT